jgi:signal peptidase I
MSKKTEKINPNNIQQNIDINTETEVSVDSIVETEIQDSEEKPKNLPSVEQLKKELREVRHKKQYGRVLRSTVYVLLISAACAVLVATIFFPILQIYGSSMEPTLSENEIVIALKTTEFEQGELVAFYVGNKILVKRFIAGPGQWIDIDEEGNVYVDGELLDEPYIKEKALGSCNIELPYQVPENKYFVLGDHRETSVDSRNTAVGCIDDDDIVGRLIFRVWPLKKIDSF